MTKARMAHDASSRWSYGAAAALVFKVGGAGVSTTSGDRARRPEAPPHGRLARAVAVAAARAREETKPPAAAPPPPPPPAASRAATQPWRRRR
jgi:hypothetical protein